MNRVRRTGIIALLVAGCTGEAEPPTAGQVLRDGVDMVMLDMRTFVTREGIRRARLEADTAEFVSETEIHMRPVSLTFYDELGVESSVITADFGIYYELTDDMEAQGNVVILDRQDDRRLETEKVRYVNTEDRLYGDVPFILTSDGGRTRLEGSSFESEPNLDSFRVPSPSGSSELRQSPAPQAVVETPAADTTAAGGELDPTPAPADSAVGQDTTGAPPDTTIVPPDTTSTPPETTSAPADTTSTPPDTAWARLIASGSSP